MPQTTYTEAPERAYPGGLADDGAHDIDTAIVDEADGIAPGLVVLRTSNGDRAAGFPASIGADADAIKTNIASAAAPQALDTSDFNGAIGAGRIFPPALIDLALSNHTDWDATSATLEGLDENGLPVSETLSIPNGGNATVTSTKYYSRVTGLTIPAQTGTGGTAQLGVSASRTLDGGDVLGVSVRTHKALASQSPDDNEVYEDEDPMPVLKQGRINVVVENAFRAGDQVLVRLVATGDERLGSVRVHDTDSGDCVPWRRARLLNSGGAGELGRLDVRVH